MITLPRYKCRQIIDGLRPLPRMVLSLLGVLMARVYWKTPSFQVLHAPSCCHAETASYHLRIHPPGMALRCGTSKAAS